MSPDAPRRILGETDTSGCGNHATVRNYFSPPPRTTNSGFVQVAAEIQCDGTSAFGGSGP
jgi:hypothetical protein